MANNRNEIVESDTDRIRQADCFLYCNIPNATDPSLSTFNESENHSLFLKTLDDLMHSTAQMMKNKQVDFIIRDLNINTPCKPEEKISTCISSSSIGNKAIERDTKIVDIIKQRTIDAIASTSRFGEDFDKTWRKNLTSVVKDFVRDVSLRYAKYVDNAVPKRGCIPHCISIGTQSDIVNEKFSSETSLDAFTKACKERRHANFILEEIAKVSDAVAKRVCLASAAENERTDSSYSLVTSMADKMEEEIFEKSLTSSIVYVKERPSIVTTKAITAVVIQRKTFVDSRESVSSTHFVQKSQDSAVYLDATDESRDATRVQVISLVEEPSKDESAHEVSSLYPKKRDFQDVAVTIATTTDEKKEEKRKKKEEKLLNEISLLDEDDKKKKEEEEKKRKEDEIFVRSMLDTIPTVQDITACITAKDDRRKEQKKILDKDVCIVDKTVDAVVDSSIIDSIQELRKDSSQINAFCSRQEAISVINDIIDSFVDTSRIEQESMETAKDILQELVSFKYKMPKYCRIDASYSSCDTSEALIERNYFITKKEKMPQCKKIRDAKNLNVSTCTFLSFTSSEPLRRSYCERLAAKMSQDDRSTLPRILQPIRCCGSLIPSNIYLGKPKYCDIRTTSYVNPQIVATREAILNDVLCPSRAIGYNVNCRSLIGTRNAPPRHCNINCCTKSRAIFENSLYTIYDTRCTVGTKYCYPRLNNIDNVQMGYYHCNNNCPVWNNNRHCERSRSYHWTRGNLYFTHPWTSRHLPRYN